MGILGRQLAVFLENVDINSNEISCVLRTAKIKKIRIMFNVMKEVLTLLSENKFVYLFWWEIWYSLSKLKT